MHEPWKLTGRVSSGLGRGASFVDLPWVRLALREQFGIEPFPGTLNLQLVGEGAATGLRSILDRDAQLLPPPDAASCAADLLPVRIADAVPGVAVVPRVSVYPTAQIEVIAALALRTHGAWRDGDLVTLSSGRIGRLDTVIFDVDGTLVDSIEGMHLAAARAAAPFGLDVPLAAVRRALNGGESLWQLIMPAAMREDREVAAILRQETLRHWPAVLEESVTVVPGLGVTLDCLRGAGLRLAIYTGSRGESLRPLERAGLMDHFEVVVTAADVSRGKPDPEGLLQCLARLDCRPETAAYVGDTRHDVEAARAAGMCAIGVLTGAADSAMLSAAGADRLAASHRTLPALLQITP